MGRQEQGFRWERGQKKVHFPLPGAKRTGQDSTSLEPQLWQVAHLITNNRFHTLQKRDSVITLYCFFIQKSLYVFFKELEREIFFGLLFV